MLLDENLPDPQVRDALRLRLERFSRQ